VAAQSVELAAEDLRLGEARYQTGTGSFVDLVDARARSAQADVDLITATYDFYLALVQLELATGLNLLPDEVNRP
jgi:outer membrane protein TolC